MFIALIHWRIKPGVKSKKAFLNHWRKNNTVNDRKGLIAEYLSDALPVKQFPNVTWHLDAESLGNFKSYVTVGMWKNARTFHAQVGRHFNDEGELLEFEQYRRRRVVFDPVAWRIGGTPMPDKDSANVI